MGILFLPMIHQINPFESKTLVYLIEKTIEKRGSQYPNPAVGAAVVVGTVELLGVSVVLVGGVMVLFVQPRPVRRMC